MGDSVTSFVPPPPPPPPPSSPPPEDGESVGAYVGFGEIVPNREVASVGGEVLVTGKCVTVTSLLVVDRQDQLEKSHMQYSVYF